ncbi:MAG: hypothetical protein IJP22_03120 [Clostridia bacterium]|nr:hypothetical protein [Clostridia bacterium]
MSLLETIRYEFCKSKQLKFFISIDGLESTLDDFIESCSSKDYCISDNGQYNLFVKNLPTLCMITYEWNDVITFYEYVGSFNEGQMSLLFLDSNFNFNFDFNNCKKDDYYKINEYYFRIDVFPDGNEFEITVGLTKQNSKDEFVKLQTLIKSWDNHNT